MATMSIGKQQQKSEINFDLQTPHKVKHKKSERLDEGHCQ
jgi:hypothetical protein